MKAKTARRRLRRNAWRMARATYYNALSSYRGLGKQWRIWVRVAVKGD